MHAAKGDERRYEPNIRHSALGYGFTPTPKPEALIVGFQLFASMKKPLKSLWQRFREDRPGQRFQDLHHQRRSAKTGRFPAERIVNAAGGIGLVVVGIILLPLPGPGWVVIAMGVGLMASEFLAVARFLDFAEVQIRNWLPSKRRKVAPLSS